MRRWAWALVLAGCGGGGGSDGGGGGGAGGGGGLRFGEAAPATARHAATYEALTTLTGADPFGAAEVGDPGAYAGSEATTPTAPQILSSVYFESDGLVAAVATLRDRRPTARHSDEAGKNITAAVLRDLTLAGGSETPDGQRGSARWYALRAVRALDEALLLFAWEGLAERSADGFDRAVASLWDDDGAPRGLGRVVAAADEACGTDHLGAARAALAGARDDFAAALEAHGLPDALQRVRIEAGQSPEYDAAIETAERELSQGLAVAFLVTLGDGGPIDANAQAELLGAYEALSARVAKRDREADDAIAAGLDQMQASGIDTEAIAAHIREHLEVGPCASR